MKAPCCVATPKPAGAIRWRRQGVVADGIAAEIALTEPLREHADLVVDTSGLPIANLRRLIERHFGAGADEAQLVVSLVSFAYPKGLPREADLVFDARFLRNPHYDPILRPRQVWIRRSALMWRPIRISRNFFYAASRTLSNSSCRGSCRKARNTLRSRLGVQVAATGPFI